MDFKTYRKMTEAEFKGRKVKTIEPLKNGWGEIPVGTVCTITRKRGGFNLTSDPCPCCGLKISISKVPPEKITLIPLEDDEQKYAQDKVKRVQCAHFMTNCGFDRRKGCGSIEACGYYTPATDKLGRILN